MSSHHAPRHRRRRKVNPSSLISTGVLTAVVGAVVAAQSMAPSSGTSTPSSRTQGTYVASASSVVARSLHGRDATQISRAGHRPSLAADSASRRAAERQAATRTEKLRHAATSAENYGRRLTRHRQAADKQSSGQPSTGRPALGAWVLPTSGFHISVWFGEAGPYWSSGYHTGIDFATAYGTPAVAVTNATVEQTGWDGAYGNQIRLQLENGDQVWYNHLSAIEVSVGETVLPGQEIGRIGETGNAYGAHLHFEYRLASDLSTAVDPKPFFSEHGIIL